MRYEHIELDLSTAACSFMLEAMQRYSKIETQPGVETELSNVRNELTARLQRKDQDPQAAVPAESWLDA